MTSESVNSVNSFKSIRIEKGLSVADVANRLKLNRTVIEKIENNDYKSLGAYTYIRGYVSNYSKLLGVDEKTYLNLIPKEELEVALVNTGSNLSQTFKYKHKSKKKNGKRILTVLLLGILGFATWYALKNYTTLLDRDNSNQELVDDNSISIMPQISIAPEQSNNEDMNSFDIPQETNELNDQTDELLIPTQNDENQSNQLDNSLNQAGLNNKEPLVSQENTDATDASDIFTVEQSQVTQNIPESKYVIEIQALTTSWVKVEQINGEKLHNDLLQPGTITLESDKPLHFRIGNKSKVKLKINGKAIELSKYSRKNIADFNWPSN